MFDADFRECPCAAVDTLYQMTQKGADTPGYFIVPMTVRTLTQITIYISGIVTDVVTGSTCAVHLSGGGVKLGDGWFPGPLISVAGAAATSGGFEFREGMKYKTNIPVVPGGTIQAECVVNGEDMGTAHMLVELQFDGDPGKIKDCDYREDDIGAAANTPVALVTRGAAVNEGGFNPSGRTIVEVLVGAALDPTGDAANGLVFAPAFSLDGPGLLNGGIYSFLGPAGPTQPDTDVSGNQGTIEPLSRKICGAGIRTQSGRINARAQNIESINPGHAIVALCYG